MIDFRNYSIMCKQVVYTLNSKEEISKIYEDYKLNNNFPIFSHSPNNNKYIWECKKLYFVKFGNDLEYYLTDPKTIINEDEDIKIEMFSQQLYLDYHEFFNIESPSKIQEHLYWNYKYFVNYEESQKIFNYFKNNFEMINQIFNFYL